MVVGRPSRIMQDKADQACVVTVSCCHYDSHVEIQAVVSIELIVKAIGRRERTKCPET